jgi:hypothetical protein
VIKVEKWKRAKRNSPGRDRLGGDSNEVAAEQLSARASQGNGKRAQELPPREIDLAGIAVELPRSKYLRDPVKVQVYRAHSHLNEQRRGQDQNHRGHPGADDQPGNRP